MTGYTIWQLSMIGLALIYAVCGIVFTITDKKNKSSGNKGHQRYQAVLKDGNQSASCSQIK